MLESSQYIDKMENREKVAEVVSRPQYVNTAKEVILPRLLGKYDHGDGSPVTQDPLYMTFFVRNTNFPWKSHGVWWLTQFRRWGMVRESPDYTGIPNKVTRPDLLREVAKEMAIAMPQGDLRKETFFDGKTFDPQKPEVYATSFSVHNIA